MKPIAIGCDEAAYELKEQIKAHLADQGMELVDFGTFDSKAVLYPDIAITLAESVSAGEQDRLAKGGACHHHAGYPLAAA